MQAHLVVLWIRHQVLNLDADAARRCIHLTEGILVNWMHVRAKASLVARRGKGVRETVFQAHRSTAALQEAITKIETLETKVAALEGS